MGNIYEDGEYFEKNPSWDLEHSPWKAQQISEILNRNHISIKNVIEIGCGAGGILAALSDYYPEAMFVGVDISPQAIKLAEKFQNSRVKFAEGNFLDSVRSDFDLIICADVFEHVDDYLGFLKELSSSRIKTVFHIPLDLAVIGVLVPQVLLRTRHRVGHLHYFSRETAEATLIDSGFKIIDRCITTGCLEFPEKGLKGRIFWAIRKLLYMANPDLAARFLGGFSLLVLAEPTENR